MLIKFATVLKLDEWTRRKQLMLCTNKSRSAPVLTSIFLLTIATFLFFQEFIIFSDFKICFSRPVYPCWSIGVVLVKFTRGFKGKKNLLRESRNISLNALVGIVSSPQQKGIHLYSVLYLSYWLLICHGRRFDCKHHIETKGHKDFVKFNTNLKFVYPDLFTPVDL
jgi:hypothetical protein